MLKCRAVRLLVQSIPWLVLSTVVVALNAAPNGDATRLLRSPTVSTTQIAFAYANNTADTPGFIDGGSMIAPRGGFFTRDGKWAVENEGVAPDIDVENWPKDVIAGKDRSSSARRGSDEAPQVTTGKPHDHRAAGARVG